MALQLNDPVTALKNVGDKRKKLYEKLGVKTVEDLLRFYPRSYIDYTSPKLAAECVPGESVVIEAKVLRKLTPAPIRKNMVLYKLLLTDGLSNVMLTIFNNEYAYYGMKVGETYLFHGKFSTMGGSYHMTLSSFIRAEDGEVMRPVYNLTEGLSNGMVVNNVKEAVDHWGTLLEDVLPPEVVSRHSLMPFGEAVRTIHFPEGKDAYDKARYRLAFEELFLLSLSLLLLKGRDKGRTEVRVQDPDMSPFYASLPFELTGAQKRAIGEILADMAGEVPMNRLLQGDVGSGKTMVAAAGCFAAFQGGFQSAIMAPTEILAAQHEATLKKVLEPLGLKICLLTGSLSKKQKDVLRAEIGAGSYDVIVGTHALVQKDTVFHRLGFVVTDEQHRFGVRQRGELVNKGERPHHLVMSATPIPRTLALIVYGDLDISVLDELPKGRQKVETFAVHSDKRKRALGFIKKELDLGHQGYIVCPLIEDSESELMAAVRYERIIQSSYFPEYKVALLHGRLKSDEKDQIMNAFKGGEIQLLVSTTVVEVGVDVPNATIMMIENAERFGLSQLHQLRGRVGRGSAQSYCILVSDNEGEENRRRLQVMKETSDGFVIAKEDLKLRGAGDFFGDRQHGLPQLGIADLLEDSALFRTAQGEAKALLERDPNLQLPEHIRLRLHTDEIFGNNDSGLN